MQETCHDNITSHYRCDRQKFPHSLPKHILCSFLFLLNTTSSTFPESKLKFRKLCRKRAMTIFQSITAATGKNSLTPSLKTYYGVSYFCLIIPLAPFPNPNYSSVNYALNVP